MKKLLLLIGAVSVPTFAASGGDLNASDYVGVSFWLVTAALLAATAFFFLERSNVSGKWKTSLTVSGLVTGIALWHYLYMRGVWVETGKSPTVFRYIDWLLTVPLLIVEFYLILRAVTNVAASLFWKLFLGSLVMLIAGYLGEISGDITMTWAYFIVGCLAWFYMIYELWAGEGASAKNASGNAAVMSAYNTMMWIIIIGWAVYPLGYYFGYLTGAEPGSSDGTLNLVYNLADFINKILFGIVIWAAAVSDSNE